MEPHKLRLIVRSLIEIYFTHHIPRVAACLTYFLTLSFFPLLICLYHMLGSFFPSNEELRSLVEGVVPAQATDIIMEFLGYVVQSADNSMLFMALGVMVTSASAAFRCIDNITSEMRGKARYGGILGLLFSVMFSLIYLVALYLAALLILTGKWFLELVDRYVMFMNISDAWSWGRFVLLFLLMFVILSLVYRTTAPRRSQLSGRPIRVLPGACFGSVAMLVVGIAFSAWIGLSTRYPVVYGSLASLILLMVWLYVCGIILLMGNALNILLERVPD